MRRQYKHNFNRSKLIKFRAGLIPIFGLAILVVALVVFPYLSWHDSAHADTTSPSSDSLTFALDKESLNLSSVNADTNGFVASNVVASITSSSSAGYNLYMSASGKDKDNAYTASLVNTNDKKYTIGTLPSSGDGSSIDLPFTTTPNDSSGTSNGANKRTYANTTNFTNNKWAYSVQDLTGKTDSEISTLTGTSTFKAIPIDETVINTMSSNSTTSSTAIDTLYNEAINGSGTTRISNIYSKDSPSGASSDGTTPDNIEVTLASRTDNTIPAGDYTNTLVFTAISKALPGIQVTFNANGLAFDTTGSGSGGSGSGSGGSSTTSTTNTVLYDLERTCKANYYTTLYSHTPNINDEGIQDGNYSNSMSTNEVLSMPGVDKLHITLTYAGESASYDWVSIWQGNHPDYTASNNYSTGITLGGQGPKFGGGNGTTVEGYVEGDTITIAFRSDGSGVGNGYGYYAVIDGYIDENGTEMKNALCGNFPLEGQTYLEPSAEGKTFLGWSTDPNSLIPTYNNGGEIIKDVGSLGEKIDLYAVWTLNSYNIVYNSNGGSGDMSMVTHTDVNYGDSVDLYAPNYWRTGYGFLGWSTDKDAGSKIGTANEPVMYGPNQTISAPAMKTSSTMTLYAVWKASEGNMQNWTGCSNMNIGDVTALKDTRDNNVYAIAKLADGKCWQVENLRLSSGTVNSTTTHNPISNFTWTASSNSWCTSHDADCDNQVLINTNNINPTLTANPSNENIDSSSWYGYGVMYNYYTATAGRGVYSMTSGNAAGDICPLGWHLPTTIPTDETGNMYNAIGAEPAKLREYPVNFVLAGYRYSDSRRGSYGGYWSATALENNGAYVPNFSRTEAYVSANGRLYKWVGTTVRCVAPTAPAGTIVYNSNGGSGDMSMVTHTNVSNNASVNLYAPNYWRSGYGFLGWSTDPQAESKIGTTSAATIYGPQETITAPSDIAANGIILYAVWKKSEGNMQDWKGCSSMSIGDVTALTDTRDNDTYAVAKLADNKCWQLENMRIHSGTIDTTTTNNPKDGFALPNSSNNWCTGSDSDCINSAMMNSNNINADLTASPTANNNSSSWYAYGVNYNWYAATAGNGTYEKASGGISGDICPLDWHLPTSTENGEFQMMYTAIGTAPANIRKYPNNFVLSGYWQGTSSGNRGSRGSYWSSTPYNNNISAYNLYNDSGYVGTSGVYAKYAGFVVRCIAG